MKKILFSLLFCAAFLSGLAQVPFNANLIIKSGTRDNLIIHGTDTLKAGWRNDRLQLRYNGNKRFMDFVKADSSVKIYNKLILESPNDTMLSVRGDAYVQNLLTTNNIVVGDSLLYSIDAGESVGDLYGYVNAMRFNPNRFYIYDDYTSYFSLLQQIKFVDTLSGIVYTTSVNGVTFNGSQTIVELGTIIYATNGNYYGYIDFGLPIAQGKIKVDGILEVADSVLVVSSADSSSTFNGVVTVNDLLNTNNIVVADSVLYSTAFYDPLIFHNITINSDGWQNLYIYIDGDVSQYFHQYDSIIVHDTIISAEYTLQVFQSYYNGVFTVLDMYGIAPFPPQGTTYGWLEFYNPVDTTVINKIIVNGIFEVADSVLIVNPADSTSTFIGTVSVEKSVKVGNDTTAASAANVGAIRYRADANNSYCEMVMQTGASTYAWVVIKQNTW